MTGDNYFTSATLVDKLSAKNVTYVGTLRSNRRDVPHAAKTTTGRTKGDSVFYYSHGQMLCSYWDKGQKPVLLLDSFAKVGIHEDAKPDTVIHYNATKSGVDNIDKQVRMYSTKRKCRRWPYGFTMNLLDIAVINVMYIFQYTRQLTVIEKKRLHYNFLISAGMQLVETHVKRRSLIAAANQPGVNRALQIILPLYRQLPMTSHLVEEFASTETLQLTNPKRCHLCPRTIDQKSRIACSSCTKAMCQDHRCTKFKHCH